MLFFRKFQQKKKHPIRSAFMIKDAFYAPAAATKRLSIVTDDVSIK